jgi:hypothetical protein
MFNSLTDRQQTLIERLIALGELVAGRTLPLDVIEIYGFGSFFRGKPRPQDVDLYLRCDRRPLREDFERFLTLAHKLRFTPTFQKQFATPQEAMHSVYRRHDGPSLPGMEDEEFERGRFCEWLEGFSWNMLHPQTIVDELKVDAPEEYAKRLIKRRLPNLNIVTFGNATDSPSDEGLSCGFVVSVWSRERRDVAANLAELFSPETLQENTHRELRNFEVQLTVLKSQLKLLRAEIDLLFQILRPQDPPQPAGDWHEQWSKDRPELRAPRRAHRQKEKASLQFDDLKWTAPIPAEYRALTHQKSLAMTERLRREIKQDSQMIEFLEEIQAALVQYQSGNGRVRRSAHEFVATDVLSRGNARQRKHKESLLQEFGIRIPARTTRGELLAE